MDPHQKIYFNEKRIIKNEASAPKLQVDLHIKVKKTYRLIPALFGKSL